MAKNFKRRRFVPRPSKRSQAAAAAAVAFCQEVRAAVADNRPLWPAALPWFDRWLRLAGREKYERPAAVGPTWCGACRAWHVAGQHLQRGAK